MYAKGRVLRLCPRLDRNVRKGSRTGGQERSWGWCQVPTEDRLGRTVPMGCRTGKAKPTPLVPQHGVQLPKADVIGMSHHTWLNHLKH